MKYDKPPPASYLKRVSVGLASGSFLGANSARRGILVSSARAAFVTITDESTAVDGAGMVIPPGFPPTHLCLYIHGDWVRHQLQCIGTAAETIGVLEILE
jgi:hypothetical protein